MNTPIVRRRKCFLSKHLALLSLLGLLAATAVSGCASAREPATTDNEVRSAVQSVLEAQQAAWNRGDIDAFMNGYDRSATTTFVSGDEVTRGWQTVLDRYKHHYK